MQLPQTAVNHTHGDTSGMHDLLHGACSYPEGRWSNGFLTDQMSHMHIEAGHLQTQQTVRWQHSRDGLHSSLSSPVACAGAL